MVDGRAELSCVGESAPFGPLLCQDCEVRHGRMAILICGIGVCERGRPETRFGGVRGDSIASGIEVSSEDSFENLRVVKQAENTS